MKTATVNFKFIFLATCVVIPVALLFIRPQATVDVKRMPRHSFETVKDQPALTIEAAGLGDNVERIEFYEGAAGRMTPHEGLVLTTTGHAGKGFAAIVFKTPVNLWEDGIALKYTIGDTKVSLGFTDDMRRPTAPDERLPVASSAAMTALTVKARDVNSFGLDKSRIKSMEIFLCGSGKSSVDREFISISEVTHVPNRRP